MALSNDIFIGVKLGHILLFVVNSYRMPSEKLSKEPSSLVTTYLVAYNALQTLG